MPEFFDVSLIIRKPFDRRIINDCLRSKHVPYSQDSLKVYWNKDVVISAFENEGYDFQEISLGFPDQIFHKSLLEEELKPFASYIRAWFSCSESVRYALGSYELNGFLLGEVTRLDQFNDELIRRFPIVFMRSELSEEVLLRINPEAQAIF